MILYKTDSFVILEEYFMKNYKFYGILNLQLLLI